MYRETTGDATQFARPNSIVGNGGSGARGCPPKLQRASSEGRINLRKAYRNSEQYRQLGMSLWMEYVDRDNRARNKEGGTDWDEEGDDDAEGATDGATDGGWCCLPEQWHCIDKEGKPFWAGDAYATGLPFQIRQLVTRQIMIVQRSPTAKVRKHMTDGQTDRQTDRQRKRHAWP